MRQSCLFGTMELRTILGKHNVQSLPCRSRGTRLHSRQADSFDNAKKCAFHRALPALTLPYIDALARFLVLNRLPKNNPQNRQLLHHFLYKLQEGRQASVMIYLMRYFDQRSLSGRVAYSTFASLDLPHLHKTVAPWPLSMRSAACPVALIS
jgi:hypothetical protein